LTVILSSTLPDKTISEEPYQYPHLGRTREPRRTDRPHIRLLAVLLQHPHKLATGKTASVVWSSLQAGIDGSREPLRLPGPGQQAFELGGLGPARDHALEHVGEPRQGLDPAHLAVATRLAAVAR
jgi:hypothetical protein